MPGAATIPPRLGEAYFNAAGPQTMTASALGEYSTDAGMARALELAGPLRAGVEARNDPTDRILTIEEWSKTNYPDLASQPQVPFFVANMMQDGYDRYLKRQELLMEMNARPFAADTQRMNAAARFLKASAPPEVSNVYEFLMQSGPEGQELGMDLVRSMVTDKSREPQATTAGLFSRTPGLFEEKQRSEIARNLRGPEPRSKTLIDLAEEKGRSGELLESKISGRAEQARPTLTKSITDTVQTFSSAVQLAGEAKPKKRFEQTLDAWTELLRHFASQDERHQPEIAARYLELGAWPSIPAIQQLWESFPSGEFFGTGHRKTQLDKAEFAMKTLATTQFTPEQQQRLIPAIEAWLERKRAALE